MIIANQQLKTEILSNVKVTSEPFIYNGRLFKTVKKGKKLEIEFILKPSK